MLSVSLGRSDTVSSIYNIAQDLYIPTINKKLSFHWFLPPEQESGVFWNSDRLVRMVRLARALVVHGT